MYNSKLYQILSFLASTTTGCISTSAFASLLGISIGITIPAMALKVYATAAETKKYNSIIKKRKRSRIKYYCYQNLN